LGGREVTDREHVHEPDASMPLVAGGELNRWWRIGLPIVTPFVRLMFRTRVEGLEHLPSSGATIVAFNHISALDGPVLAIEIGRRIKRESRFLVAAEFFRRGFSGWILRRYDQIPIHRGEGDDSALEAALDAVREGVLLAMAPEGTVNADPDTLMRIRSGVSRIALPSGAPVVPVGIWGTHRRWPRSGLSWVRPWRPRLAIVFGEPLLPSGDDVDDAEVEAFAARLRRHLVRQVERARSLSGEPP
jgi:1-acyl-sn-glycerol-3-phosphate acyltransferase